MPNIRILRDGRLVLGDGTRLDVEHVSLSQDAARRVAAEADLVVESSVTSTADVSTENARIDELLRSVDGREGTAGARQYRGGRRVALVLTEFC